MADASNKYSSVLEDTSINKNKNNQKKIAGLNLFYDSHTKVACALASRLV